MTFTCENIIYSREAELQSKKGLASPLFIPESTSEKWEMKQLPRSLAMQVISSWSLQLELGIWPEIDFKKGISSGETFRTEI